jgi:hypothetical protein
MVVWSNNKNISHDNKSNAQSEVDNIFILTMNGVLWSTKLNPLCLFYKNEVVITRVC